VEGGSVAANVEAKSCEEGQRRPTVRTSQSKPAGRHGGKERRAIDSIELQDTEEDDSSTDGRMKLKQLIAAAKRQKRQTSTDVSSSQLSLQSAADVAVYADADHTGQATATTKPGKSTRGLRGRAKMRADTTAPAAAATSDKQQQGADDLQMSSFWQKTALQEWAPLGTDIDKAGTGDQGKTAGSQSAAKQTPPASDVDMNEAVEMTKLFLAGPQAQPQQQLQQ